jgi:hypothetical protein
MIPPDADRQVGRVMTPRLLTVAALFIISACASLSSGTGGPASVMERLYFGRAIGDTGQVTDSQWTTFLADVVTPRFPDGFTVFRAQGQWRGRSGVVQRESTYVVEVVRLKLPARAAVVDTIIAEYRRRFLQEAVLRVITETNVKF